MRSFAIASRMKAIDMREHQRFEAERRQPYALERLIGGRPRQHGAKRRPQQEQRTVREQQKDRRPARHQRLGASAPELVSGQPCVRGDDAGRDQEAKFELLADDGHVTGHQPHHRSGDDRQRQRPAPVKHASAGPRHGKGEEQDRIGEVDRDRLRYLAKHSKQHDRTRAHQMRKSPPGHGANLQVLHPGKQQQKTKDRLDIDRNKEERVDVEIHSLYADCRKWQRLNGPSLVSGTLMCHHEN